MATHTPQQSAGPWRRWMFRIWIGVTIVLGAFVIVTALFFGDERVSHFLVGVPVPVTMIVLLFLGLGWLVWLVTARRRGA